MASGAPSIALDNSPVRYGGMGRDSLEACATALLGRHPRSLRDYDAIGARLAKARKRRKPYDGYYIRSVIKGDNPMTLPLVKAVDNLWAEIEAEPPDVEYRQVTVQVPNGMEIPEGTVLLKDAVTCICGTSFIPTTWNQINHTRACAAMRTKVRTDSRTT